jgi:hypothetical protein
LTFHMSGIMQHVVFGEVLFSFQGSFIS